MDANIKKFSIMLAMVYEYFLVPAMAASSMAAADPRQNDKKCREFYYYDHGTEHCENCRDICVAAKVKRTMDQCWELCQPYALVLWPPKDDTPAPPHSPSMGSDESSTFPLAAKIALALLCGFIIAGVVLTLVIFRRRQNALKNRRNTETPPPPDPNTNPALISLLGHAGENDRSMNASARATLGTGASRSTTGIQEQGGGDSEGGLADGRRSILAQATPSFLAGRTEPLRSHGPVSPEGNSASFALALPGGSNPAATFLRIASLPVDADYDSTELKTLLPSISNDSLLMEARGGQNPTMTNASTRV